MTIQEYATSTVAMSAYNLLAVRAGRASQGDLLDVIRVAAHPSLTEDQFSQAIDALQTRGYIAVSGEVVELTDQSCRLVLDRDRSDAWVDDASGIIIGGWNGWMIGHPGGALEAIEEVVR